MLSQHFVCMWLNDRHYKGQSSNKQSERSRVGTKMTNDSGNVTKCSPYDSYDYVIVAAASSGSAIVSALCCVFVICLIVLLKKHHFFIQRIILYHCLAALFRATALMLRLHRLGYQHKSTALSVLCSICGFMDQLTLWYLVVDFSVITFTLLMTAVFHKNVSRLEGLFVVLIFIFPLTFNWIPFINNSYGRFGAWCWIRNLNYDDCSEFKFGSILQDVLWIAPSSIFLIFMIPVYIIVIIFVARRKCSRRYQYHSIVHDPDAEVLTKTLNDEVWPLLFFPFGLLLLNLLPLANEIHDTVHINNPSYGLSLASAIVYPLQGGYIAVVYTLDRDTFRRLTCSNLVAMLCRRKEDVQEYPAEVGRLSDSVSSRDKDASLATNFIYRSLSSDNERLSLLRTT